MRVLKLTEGSLMAAVSVSGLEVEVQDRMVMAVRRNKVRIIWVIFYLFKDKYVMLSEVRYFDLIQFMELNVIQNNIHLALIPFL